MRAILVFTMFASLSCVASAQMTSEYMPPGTPRAAPLAYDFGQPAFSGSGPYADPDAQCSACAGHTMPAGYSYAPASWQTPMPAAGAYAVPTGAGYPYQTANYLSVDPRAGAVPGAAPYGSFPGQHGNHPTQQAVYNQTDYLNPQQPEVLPVSYSTVTKGGHAVSVHGAVGQGAPSGGASFRAATSEFLKGVEFSVHANEDQVVMSAGGIVALLNEYNYSLAGRFLASYIMDDDENTEQGFSFDLYGARRIQRGSFEHFIKGGFFYDSQVRATRYGPLASAIFFADNRAVSPTIDIALGFGEGEKVPGDMMTEVADQDFQVRTGLYLFETTKVGVSAQYYHWDNPDLIEDIWSVGGYLQRPIGNWLLTAECGVADGRTRGSLSMVYQPGTRLYGGGNSHQGWMIQPVARDLAMRFGRKRPADAAATATGADVGNITTVTCELRFPPRAIAGGAGDANANGILDNNDGFEIDLIFENGTSQTANAVSYDSVTVIGNATLVGTAASNPTTIPAGATGQTSAAEDINIQVVNAMAGDQINVEFTVNADGQIRRFRCGPIIVGSALVDQTQVVAMPL